jgi:hypothetical protein
MQLQNFFEDVLHMFLFKRQHYMNIFSSLNFLKNCWSEGEYGYCQTKRRVWKGKCEDAVIVYSYNYLVQCWTYQGLKEILYL